ncbi:uncharacterized protein AB9X84_019066 isoform 2-T2 [Acanthopagrus schlegelii]
MQKLQFCSGAQPVMRVFKTVLYKQEVIGGCFIWRPEAMCGTHRCELVLRPDENQVGVRNVVSYPQFYVWDHVAVALHVDRQMLNFHSARLRQNLKYCSRAKPSIIPRYRFDDFPEAKAILMKVCPKTPSPSK